MAEFASKGVAGTALGLGVAGSVGLLSQMGILGNNCGGGGLFGGNNGSCVETKESSCLRQQNAQLAAERYADQVAISAYKDSVALSNSVDAKQAANFKEAFSAIVTLSERTAKLESGVTCLNQKLDYEIDGVTKGYQSAIALESERRKCGDENLYAYVNATFVPGKLIMPLSSICPPAEPATTAPANG